jgi:flagellar L-ring protein precursor FlgH
MNIKTTKFITLLMALSIVTSPVYAESLFRTGVSQNVYTVQPRSLYGTVRAKSIGDLVTIIIEQSISTADNVQFNVKKSSTTTDNFSSILNNVFHSNKMVPDVNGFGGASETKNQSTLTRTSTLKDTMTAQVVQILPNGNLVVQGKKVAMNSGEKVDIILSGIVDPRLLDNQGRISSNLVANLQIGVVGQGSVSRSDSEGTFSKVLRYLF